MRVGYCKVYWSCFRTFGAKVLEIFVLMIRQFHRNESSWNVRSRGTKVPRERMFHGTKVLGTFAPKVPREQKFQGANVPWNESSTGAKVLSMDFSLPGTKVQRNEKAWNQQDYCSNQPISLKLGVDWVIGESRLTFGRDLRRRILGYFSTFLSIAE